MGKLSFLAGALAVMRLFGHFTDPLLSSAQIHQVIGEPSRFPLSTSNGQVSIVSWNIGRGVNFDEIKRELQRIDADILLLQEVDLFCRRSGNRNVARDLADALHMNWVAAGEFQEIGEASGDVPALTGQAILSKTAIANVSVVVFKRQTNLLWRLSPVQPRRGGRMALTARTAGIHVYNTHIESGGDDVLRTRQMNELVAQQARHPSGTEPFVIAGDFNNPPVARSAMFQRLFAEGFVDALGNDPRRRTSSGHRHPIDWIFVKNLSVGKGYVARTDDVSDHYAVVASVSQPKAAAGAPHSRPQTDSAARAAYE